MIGNDVMIDHLEEWGYLATPWQPPAAMVGAGVTPPVPAEPPAVEVTHPDPPQPDRDDVQQQASAEQLRRWGADPDDTNELTRVIDLDE